jgi:hypothetical protein
VCLVYVFEALQLSNRVLDLLGQVQRRGNLTPLGRQSLFVLGGCVSELLVDGAQLGLQPGDPICHPGGRAVHLGGLALGIL